MISVSATLEAFADHRRVGAVEQRSSSLFMTFGHAG